MKHRYEFIEHHEHMPFTLFINSIDHIPFHWHKELELIYVLKGSVEIHVAQERLILREEDLLVINSMDVHKIDKTGEANVLLTLQVDPGTVQAQPQQSKNRIDCSSLNARGADEARFAPIRSGLAQMMWGAEQAGGRLQRQSDGASAPFAGPAGPIFRDGGAAGRQRECERRGSRAPSPDHSIRGRELYVQNQPEPDG
ncbi:cupin domain-containing protein [Paenibacillus sp. AR247]|uniref:cupin domain-containing protein n=1 Tax=Paenibacillus sp. AR247 TaxID=1631599 RepID=UPI0021575148|nr:cupin domain-containing protein [Paenibacillus sp. AR247]